MPTGQPNSTVLMSPPMRLLSSEYGSALSQSPTASPPVSVRKKITGTRLPGLFGFTASVPGISSDRFSFFIHTSVPHMVHASRRSASGCLCGIFRPLKWRIAPSPSPASECAAICGTLLLRSCPMSRLATETTDVYQPVRAPRGTAISCKGWQQEAALRMLMNNLDPEVAEKPEDLIVYGGTGRAARSWACYHAIVKSLRELENDETLLVPSGKPVAVFRSPDYAPRVLIANSNLVGHWSNWKHFDELDRAGLMMYGQLTAGSWIYIGSQGILQGTYETFAAAGRKHFQSADLGGKLVVSGGMGGMGGAQPLAATLNGAGFLGIEVDPERIKRRVKAGYCDVMVTNLDESLRILHNAVRKRADVSVGLVG